MVFAVRSTLAHSNPVEHLTLIAVAAVALAVYTLAWWRRPRSSLLRLGAWTAGVTAVVAALAPSLEEWAQRSFTGHMVQHLLLIVVAAPLLVLARPGRFVPHPDVPRSAARIARQRGPALGAAVFVLVLVLTHLTEIYDKALTTRWVHDIEHVAYLGAAIGLWAGLTAPRPGRGAARIGAVFAVIGTTALLGVVLLTAQTPLIDTYAARMGTEDALADQRRAAALMWIAGMGTTLPLLGLVVWRWAAAEERMAHRREAMAMTESTAPPGRPSPK